MTHQVIPIEHQIPIQTIRIERDYSLGDGITRFSTQYPTELTGKVKRIFLKIIIGSYSLFFFCID
ncbi:hypothetical protein BD560DRAFT_417644 [Blakeslea trispora]|nr:hypothetical protein BD560DRAFT_417644 [Blakeslea trispora]